MTISVWWQRWQHWRVSPAFWSIIWLTVGALAIRLATYDRYLPYADYTDEAVYIAYAQEIRGLGQQEGLRAAYGELAHLYVALNVVAQEVYDIVKPHDYNIIMEYYYVLRFLSVLMGVATTLLIFAIGHALGGWLAGLVAGMLWAFSSWVVMINNLAIPDGLLFLCVAMAIWGAIRAWQTESSQWLLVSLLAGIAGIYTKLWTVMAILPFLWVVAVFLYRDVRRYWRPIVAQLLLGGGFAFYFLFVLNPFQSSATMSDYSGTDLLQRLFNLNTQFNNFFYAYFPITNLGAIAPLAFWGVIIGGGIAYRENRRAQLTTIAWHYWVFMWSYILFSVFITAMVSVVSESNRLRHIFPATIIVFTVWGLAFAQIRLWLQHQFGMQRARWIWGTALATLLAVHLIQGVALIQQYQRTHVVQVVHDWVQQSLPVDSGWVLVPSGNEMDNIFNPLWGGYVGKKPFLWWFYTPQTLTQRTAQAYNADNIPYLLINDFALKGKYNTPEVRQLLDDMMLIKTFHADPSQVAGSTIYIYGTAYPPVTTNVPFDDTLTLMGYYLSNASPRPGDTVVVRAFWRLNMPTTLDLRQFIHLYSTDLLTVLSQSDGLLAQPDRPVNLWQDTDEVYIGADFLVAIPTELAEGRYRLALGLYDNQSGNRLSTPMGDFYEIAITVEK